MRRWQSESSPVGSAKVVRRCSNLNRHISSLLRILTGRHDKSLSFRHRQGYLHRDQQILCRSSQRALIIGHKFLDTLGRKFVCDVKGLPWKVQIQFFVWNRLQSACRLHRSLCI